MKLWLLNKNLYSKYCKNVIVKRKVYRQYYEIVIVKQIFIANIAKLWVLKNIIKLGALNKNVYKKIKNRKCRIRK